jgi:hypothetical protein
MTYKGIRRGGAMTPLFSLALSEHIINTVSSSCELDHMRGLFK